MKVTVTNVIKHREVIERVFSHDLSTGDVHSVDCRPTTKELIVQIEENLRSGDQYFDQNGNMYMASLSGGYLVNTSTRLQIKELPSEITSINEFYRQSNEKI